MRSPVALILLFGLALSAQAQSPRPQPTRSATPKATPQRSAAASPSSSASTSASSTPAPPQFRPSVLRQGADSLVNRIDVKGLLAKGQKDGAVQFAAVVNADGTVEDAATYHALPDSQALETEVLTQLKGARFTPPIYEHQPVKALVYGTVLWDADSAPHLRILLNQDPNEIQKGDDFIGPQPVIGADSPFKGLHPPEDLPVQMTGVVNLALAVDDKGVMHGAQVMAEEPPLVGLAAAVVDDFEGAKFIPGFLNGDPTDSETLMSVCYKPTEEDEPLLKLAAPTPPEP